MRALFGKFDMSHSLHLSAALEAAQAASELIRKAFRGNFQVDYKADASPVTVIRREAGTW